MSRDAWHGTIKHGTVVTWFHTSNAGINKKSKTQHQQVSGYQPEHLVFTRFFNGMIRLLLLTVLLVFIAHITQLQPNMFMCTCSMLLVVFQDLGVYKPCRRLLACPKVYTTCATHDNYINRESHSNTPNHEYVHQHSTDMSQGLQPIIQPHRKQNVIRNT